MSTVDSSDVVQSGFGEISKRRAVELARATRPAKQTTARSRISAAKAKKGRVAPLGPTEARLAKGDVLKVGGVHRSIPPIEDLRNKHKLVPGDERRDFHENQMLFEAGVRLHRHRQGCQIGVKAQDLDGALLRGAFDDLEGEEAWVAHYRAYQDALEVMGYHPTRPHHGAARIVVAVACDEMTLRDAADAHLPALNQNAKQGIALDRLRAGLFELAKHWRMISG